MFENFKPEVLATPLSTSTFLLESTFVAVSLMAEFPSAKEFPAVHLATVPTIPPDNAPAPSPPPPGQ
jgi:hypothetical protein